MPDQSTSSPAKKRGMLGKVLVALAAILILAIGGYLGALAYYTPEDNVLESWEQTLDVALAKTRPVLVKAGSKW